MEQVIGLSCDLKDFGDPNGAYKILMELCQADLRCLDAHAHPGNLEFDRWAKDAARHYEVGFRNPSDNQGIRFLIDDVVGKWPWEHP
jgi:hypothetical protein